jgi:hypothetical protein
VSVLSEKAPGLDKPGSVSAGIPLPAVIAAHVASVDFLDRSRGPFLDFEAMRPVRAHLFLRVLLI